MWTEQDLNVKSDELYFTDTHVELKCVFTTEQGEVVDVTSPSISFDPSTPPQILQPVMLDNDTPPRYSIKFLTTGMDTGDYSVTFSGTYNGDTLSVPGTFTLQTISRVQGLILTLRALLKDMLPVLYLVKVPDDDTFRWKDGELYTCIIQALSFLNSTPPSNLVYDIANFPFEAHLLNIAMAYAFNQRSMLEIANTLNYSDEVSFSLDKDAKYASKAQAFFQMWMMNWISTKKDHAFHTIQSEVVISSRYPLHFIRPLSLLPNSKNTFGWF